MQGASSKPSGLSALPDGSLAKYSVHKTTLTLLLGSQNLMVLHYERYHDGKRTPTDIVHYSFGLTLIPLA